MLYTNEQIITHLTLKPDEVEQLIEWWVMVNPADTPTPKSEHTVYVNKKIGEINNYIFLFLVKNQLLDNLQRQERFATLSISLLYKKPIEFLKENINGTTNIKKR